MRVGISITSAYDVADPREGARRMIDRARAAEPARLDSLFVGDHHATPQPYYQNSPIMGRLLAEWGDRPFGALYLLPLWHPVLLAEQVGTLRASRAAASSCSARSDPPIASSRRWGSIPSSARRASRSRSRSCGDCGPAKRSRATAAGSFERARIAPRPAEPVEVWIGAAAPPAIDRAARLGDGWLAAPASRRIRRRQIDRTASGARRTAGRGSPPSAATSM